MKVATGGVLLATILIINCLSCTVSLRIQNGPRSKTNRDITNDTREANEKAPDRVSMGVESAGDQTPILAAQSPPSILNALNVSKIKTPQLIGIIAGCLVFITTISVVFYLLIQSGTLARFRDEMLSGAPLSLSLSGKRENTAPQFSALPQLYEHLLDAAAKLPAKPEIQDSKGQKLTLRPLDLVLDSLPLIEASNGTALYGESKYDPARIWGWMQRQLPPRPSTAKNGKKGQPSEVKCWPSDSRAVFEQFFAPGSDCCHFTAVDNRLQKQIGMVSLVDNAPRDLSVRIDNLWITPAYQSKLFAHETMLITLQSLFMQNYRRVTVEVDNRHIIMRKFLERCGFKLEAVLRKHRIVDSRNSDTALYVLLNSEWPETEIKLKKLLGLDLRPKMQKAFEIDKPSSVVVSTNRAAGVRGASAGSSAGNGSSAAETAAGTGEALSKSQKARMRKKKSKDLDSAGR